MTSAGLEGRKKTRPKITTRVPAVSRYHIANLALLILTLAASRQVEVVIFFNKSLRP
jgi:hypothetical protein